MSGGRDLQRRSFERDGIAFAWYDTGEAGVPVLFQHGLCGDARQTAEAFPPDAGFRLLTLECRGHGHSGSGSATSFSLMQFADDLAALLDHLALGPIIVGGLSMGAALAMRLAVCRPDLVSALALVRPAWSTGAAPPNLAPNAEVGDLLARLPPDQAAAAFDAGATAKRLEAISPDNLVSLRCFFSREPLAVTAALLTRIAADGPGVSADALRSLQLPALVIGSDADAIHPWPLAVELAGLIPGARLVRVTPKGVDKTAYLADLHSALGAFFKDVTHA